MALVMEGDLKDQQKRVFIIRIDSTENLLVKDC